MDKIFSVLDFTGATDSERIQKAVDQAASNRACVVIPKDGSANGLFWEIDKAIEIHSFVKIVLDGAHLRLKDGVYDNIFRSANFNGDRHVAVTNVVITGKNGATLDGGVHNRLTEYNHSRDGLPHIYVNNLILLYNVRDYEISNLNLYNPRYWCINQLYCSYAVLKNLNFWADGVMPNQDGINLRLGCHHFVIENVTGRTGDDTVALTGCYPIPENVLQDRDVDIHHVSISNVRSTTNQTIVALRAADGVKLHDIIVDGVESLYDPNDDQTFLPWGVVRIGEGLYYRYRHSIAGEIYNITVKNVKANGKYGVALSNTLQDCLFENISAFGKCPAAIMTDFKWWTKYPDDAGGVTLSGCMFKDISYNPDSVEARKIGFLDTPIEPACFLFKNMKSYDKLTDCVIKGVKVKKGVKFMSLPEFIDTHSVQVDEVSEID